MKMGVAPVSGFESDSGASRRSLLKYGGQSRTTHAGISADDKRNRGQIGYFKLFRKAMKSLI